jgi:hypothetical protein
MVRRLAQVASYCEARYGAEVASPVRLLSLGDQLDRTGRAMFVEMMQACQKATFDPARGKRSRSHQSGLRPVATIEPSGAGGGPQDLSVWGTLGCELIASEVDLRTRQTHGIVSV